MPSNTLELLREILINTFELIFCHIFCIKILKKGDTYVQYNFINTINFGTDHILE